MQLRFRLSQMCRIEWLYQLSQKFFSNPGQLSRSLVFALSALFSVAASAQNKDVAMESLGPTPEHRQACLLYTSPSPRDS